MKEYNLLKKLYMLDLIAPETLMWSLPSYFSHVHSNDVLCDLFASFEVVFIDLIDEGSLSYLQTVHPFKKEALFCIKHLLVGKVVKATEIQ